MEQLSKAYALGSQPGSLQEREDDEIEELVEVAQEEGWPTDVQNWLDAQQQRGPKENVQWTELNDLGEENGILPEIQEASSLARYACHATLSNGNGNDLEDRIAA